MNTKHEFQITYFLWTARKDKNNLCPVYLVSMQNTKKQIRYNTGLKLDPLQWNNKRNEPRNKPVQLIELENRLKENYRQLFEIGHNPTLADLVKYKTKPKGLTIVQWCEDYIKGAYSEGQKHAVGTIRTNMIGFNEVMTFERFKRPVIKDFFNYLSSQGVANNSQYKRLRALINVAEHANIKMEPFEMPYQTGNAIKPRLTWDEVKAVMNTEANGIEATAKDVFLIACFAGLRIDDILALNKGTLHPFYYERLQGKTKLPVWVTRHKYNSELLEKYIGGVTFERQTLSTHLKKVLERSGKLSTIITRTQAVGHNTKEKKVPKYKEISFHSGRRFYARLLNDLGLGNEIARDELGHSYKSVTELYAGSQDHALRIKRVQLAVEGLEKTMEQLSALMKVA